MAVVNYLSAKVLVEEYATLPANSKTGRLILLTTDMHLYSCINGYDRGGDTTLRGNWRRIEGDIGVGQDPNKVLVTDGADSITYRDCDGGSIS